MKFKYSKENLDSGFSEADFIFFWGHIPAKGGQITESCLSQWWKCNFMENGVVFCCAEQYMMYKKALLFEDYEYACKILESKDPKEIKEYGRLIRNFNEEQWNLNKQEIVVQGNILKFSQNAELREYLRNTNAKILVEASPYDRIWGIGMKKGTAAIFDPLSWKGENLLGFSIMEARDRVC